MYVIIVGAGQGGVEPRARAARQGPRGDLARGRPPAATSSSRQELGYVAQYGDATELWILERAGVQRTDLVIACHRRRRGQRARLPRSLRRSTSASASSRASTTRATCQHFKLLGIQPVVSATDLILRLIEHEGPALRARHLLALEEERSRSSSSRVQTGAPAAGLRVADVQLPAGQPRDFVLRAGRGFVPTPRDRRRGRRSGSARARLRT